ncbi:FecR family protein [Luteimonas aquatica]|uniref:FecR family protein n=1 Tax=Luteimonas aquatica TaxID=450364 RepID=UPI001F57D098|nr:FecR family protein [Luteimonas aquatica]
MTPIDDSIRQAAADWFARRRDGIRSADADAAFEDWRRRSADHARAYADLERAWDDWGAAARESPRLRAMAAEALAATARPPRRVPWKPLLLAASVAAMAVLGVWHLLPTSVPETPQAVVYRTQVGEQRSERLADGSRIILNTDSELRVRYGAAKREIALTRGEALFEVAHDPRHPFVVAAAGGTVTALGTRFRVRDDAGAAAVTLLEGKVEVAALRQRRVLAPGDEARYGGAAADIRVRRVDPEAAIGWIQGRLDFNGLPLAEAVAEANRYSAVKLRLGDPGLADLQVGGSFRTGDNAAIAAAFAAAFPVRVASRDGQEIVLMPRK